MRDYCFVILFHSLSSKRFRFELHAEMDRDDGKTLGFAVKQSLNKKKIHTYKCIFFICILTHTLPVRRS